MTIHYFFAKRALTAATIFFLASSSLTAHSQIYANKEWTTHVMHEIKPYFLSAYQEGHQADKAVREIDGVTYAVERFNHGLAHGLRQGALAKDIMRLLGTGPSASSRLILISQ